MQTCVLSSPPFLPLPPYKYLLPLSICASAHQQAGVKATVVDARFCKPLDTVLIRQLAKEHPVLITVEEGSIGGFASHVMQVHATRSACMGLQACMHVLGRAPWHAVPHQHLACSHYHTCLSPPLLACPFLFLRSHHPHHMHNLTRAVPSLSPTVFGA
jgi:hypothetical protein